MSNQTKIKPGLRGDYRGSCVVCLRPTDTGLASEGEAGFAVAMLIELGVPEGQAPDVVGLASGVEPGMAYIGRQTVVSRVCARCATAAGFVAPGLLATGAPVPRYVQPDD